MAIGRLRASPTAPNLVDFRRRDYPTMPIIVDGKAGTVVLAGVFTPTNGAYTVPVEIDQRGVPSQADPRRAARSSRA